jgi:hypothetical protein
MSVAIVAFHYPRPEHRAELVARVRQAAEVMRSVPGCLAADCWENSQTGAVVTTGVREDADARQAAFRSVAAAGVDFEYDEREARPRDVYSLTPV